MLQFCVTIQDQAAEKSSTVKVNIHTGIVLLHEKQKQLFLIDQIFGILNQNSLNCFAQARLEPGENKN